MENWGVRKQQDLISCNGQYPPPPGRPFPKIGRKLFRQPTLNTQWFQVAGCFNVFPAKGPSPPTSHFSLLHLFSRGTACRRSPARRSSTCRASPGAQITKAKRIAAVGLGQELRVVFPPPPPPSAESYGGFA